MCYKVIRGRKAGPTKHRIERIERIGRQGTVVVLTVCSQRRA